MSRKYREWEQRKNPAGRVVRWAWIEGAQGKVHPSPPEATARRGYPNSAIDSTNRTRSTCREIGSFW